MKTAIVIVFLIVSLSSCGHTIKKLPGDMEGKWSNTLPIEGTDGKVENEITIAGDTLILKQSFPRMSGIDKIKTTYIANRIEQDEDGIYSFYTSTENIKSRIVIHQIDAALEISICQLNGEDNKDAQFTSCTELGSFAR